MSKSSKLYKPGSNGLKPLGIAFIIIGVLIFAGISLMGYALNENRQQRNELVETDLCELTTPGILTVRIMHNIEPVDFVLISPSGLRFVKPEENSQSNDFTAFESTDEYTSMSLKTHETGKWKISYNTKRNTAVEVSADLGPLPDSPEPSFNESDTEPSENHLESDPESQPESEVGSNGETRSES